VTSCGTGAGSEAGAGAGAAAAAEVALGALGVVGGSGGSRREGCDVAGSCGSGVLEGGGGSMDSVDCIRSYDSGHSSQRHNITLVISIQISGCNSFKSHSFL
jgi:hypothetical protein